MDEIECNAKIISSSISMDGMRLTFMITVEFDREKYNDGGVIGIGSYNLSPYQNDDWIPDFCYFIERVLKLADSNSWEDLPGKIIRIKIANGIVTDIGNAIYDDWINIKQTLYPDHIKELNEVS
jgi:hypothetical protein